GVASLASTWHGGQAVFTPETSPAPLVLGLAAHPAVGDTARLVVVPVLSLAAHPAVSDAAKLTVSPVLGLGAHPGIGERSGALVTAGQIGLVIHPAIEMDFSGIVSPVVWMPVLYREGRITRGGRIILDRRGH